MPVQQHVAVFGATGRVGSAAMQKALDAGHRVTAMVRTPSKLSLTHENLRVVTANAVDPASVLAAMTEAGDLTAALMAVGVDPFKTSTVVTDSVRAIVAAMTQLGVNRYVGVSGTANMPTSSALARLSLVPVRRFIKASADHAAAYEIVRDSTLDYVLAGCPYIRLPRTGTRSTRAASREASRSSPPRRWPTSSSARSGATGTTGSSWASGTDAGAHPGLAWRGYAGAHPGPGVAGRARPRLLACPGSMPNCSRRSPPGSSTTGR